MQLIKAGNLKRCAIVSFEWMAAALVWNGYFMGFVMAEWFEDDGFWRDFAPFMFHERRLQGTVAEVDQVLDLCRVSGEAAVLDLGCGMGRHSLELARRGFSVTGVDLSALYLDKAREAAAEQGLAVEFLRRDMRRFVRLEAFDLAINLYTSFGYFEEGADNQLVLDNIFQSLKPGGVLLMELASKEILARMFEERDWREQGDALMLEERRVIDDWKRIWNRWILIKDGRRRDYEFSHWVYSAAELEMMLIEAGFGEVAFFRGLDGGEFDHHFARMVAVGKK